MNAPHHRELPAHALDAAAALEQISAQWDGDILRQLTDYIAVPAKSPGFDADWAQHGFIDTVVRNAAQWVEAQKVPGLKLEVVRIEGRTPVIFFEIDGTKAGSTQTVVMYGHLDKQPEFSGWRSDLGPWTPKYEDGKLYGRGGADDGYAVYAAIAAVQALKRQNVPHPRIVGLVETSEESGSPDLLPYIDALRPRLGDVGLVVCLDSGAGNYDQLWLTTSLRGMASGTLKVEVLTEGVHSGDASRLNAPRPSASCGRCWTAWKTVPPACCRPASCDIPAERVEQARATAAIWATTCSSVTLGALRLRRRVSLGAAYDGRPGGRAAGPHLALPHAQCDRCREGLPTLQDAGNVLRPTPPSSSAFACRRWWTPRKPCRTRNACWKTTHPTRPASPSRAVAAPAGTRGSGAWFAQALDAASQAHFGAPCGGYIGRGTIPLMNQLSENTLPRR